MSGKCWQLFFLTTTIFALGCEAPPKASGPTELYVRISDRDAFIDNALTKLRETDFQPRLAERREGLIVAGPATSGQWFEWWRVDSQGSYQVFESSIHTMRRTVTVKIEPSAGVVPASDGTAIPITTGTGVTITDLTTAAAEVPTSGDYRLSVQVEKERYSAPERQATTAVGAMAIYNERLPTAEGLRNARSVGEHWIPQGRDVLLEAYFLDAFASLPGVAQTSAPGR